MFGVPKRDFGTAASFTVLGSGILGLLCACMDVPLTLITLIQKVRNWGSFSKLSPGTGFWTLGPQRRPTASFGGEGR